MTKPKLQGLEIGRGLAAGLVVLHHAGNIAAEPRFFGHHPFGGLFQNFNVGVDFFFVLSGFIITWIHWGDVGNIQRLAGYARKRVIRIYPPYLLLLVPLCLAYALFPNAGQPSQHDPLNMVFSALLLPYPAEPVLGVAWTLVHEMFFYALFGVLIAGGRKAVPILVVWAVAILVANLTSMPAFPTSFFLSPFNLEFLLGVATARLLQTRTLSWGWILLPLGALTFGLSLVFWRDAQDIVLRGRAVYGLASAAMVIGIVEIERKRPWTAPKSVLLFGAASYSLYLVHPLVISVGYNLSRRLHNPLSIELTALVLSCVALVVGIAYHLLVEKPVIGFLSRGARPRARLAPAGE